MKVLTTVTTLKEDCTKCQRLPSTHKTTSPTFASVKEANRSSEAERFPSSKELGASQHVARFPSDRTLEHLAGRNPVKRFKDRKTAVSRILAGYTGTAL